MSSVYTLKYFVKKVRNHPIGRDLCKTAVLAGVMLSWKILDVLVEIWKQKTSWKIRPVLAQILRNIFFRCGFSPWRSWTYSCYNILSLLKYLRGYLRKIFTIL